MIKDTTKSSNFTEECKHLRFPDYAGLVRMRIVSNDHSRVSPHSNYSMKDRVPWTSACNNAVRAWQRRYPFLLSKYTDSIKASQEQPILKGQPRILGQPEIRNVADRDLKNTGNASS